jgi:hypothetical protein
VLNEKLETLESETTTKDFLNFNYLLNSFKIDYPEFKQIKINRGFGVNSDGVSDTSYVLFVQFDKNCLDKEKPKLKNKLSQRFKFELKQNSKTVQDSIPVIVF